DGALRLRLAGKTDQRLRLGRVDVAKLLDLFTFTRRNVREFLCATEHADPTRPAGRRATFNRNRSLDPARIQLAPVAGAIVSGAPRKILRVIQTILRVVVVLVKRDGPLLVDGFEKTEEPLAVVNCAFPQNVVGRLARVLLVDEHLSRR